MARGMQTDEELEDQIVIYREEGMTYQKISKLTGIPFKTAWNIVKRERPDLMAQTKTGLSREDRDIRIVKLKKQGMTHDQIIEMLGVSMGTITNVLRKKAPELLLFKKRKKCERV